MQNKRLAIEFLLLFFMVAIMGFNPACRESPSIATSGDPKESPSYTIIKSETFHDIKRSLEVRLSERISKEKLRDIAHELKSQESRNYDRTFIVYYLPSMDSEGRGWATTHFNPDLEIRILGSTKVTHEQIEESLEAKLSDNVVGRWETEFSEVITFFQKGGTLFKHTIYADGSERTEKLTIQRVDSEARYRTENSHPSDYMVITENGNLAFGDNTGIWSTAPKTDNGDYSLQIKEDKEAAEKLFSEGTDLYNEAVVLINEQGEYQSGKEKLEDALKNFRKAKEFYPDLGKIDAAISGSESGVRHAQQQINNEIETKQSAEASGEPYMVRVSVRDRTERNPIHSRSEIRVNGRRKWWIKRELSFGAHVENIGPFATGEQHTISVYPDSREGKEFEFPFILTDDMSPEGSPRDMIFIHIWDTKVIGRGTPIKAATVEFKIEYER